MAHVASIALLLLLLLPPFLVNGTSSSTRRVPMKLEENVTHLRFYFHQTIGGRNATAARLLPPAAPASGRSFGELTVMDNPLTEGPEPTSRLVGRAQGLYAGAAMEEMGFIQAMNVVFTDARYGGSSITILGRNAPMLDVREIPVVGGNGMFRLARGYAVLRTHSFVGNSAVVEYSVCVMHPATPLNIMQQS